MKLPVGFDRRRDRRHDLSLRDVIVERWDGYRNEARHLGRLVDLSAGGVRIECEPGEFHPATHLRLRLRLPEVSGLRPFANAAEGLEPSNEWVGWMEVARVINLPEGRCEIGGRLLDMQDLDRGMLKLYLSVQPLAA
jgi:hypothetical protein